MRLAKEIELLFGAGRPLFQDQLSELRHHAAPYAERYRRGARLRLPDRIIGKRDALEKTAHRKIGSVEEMAVHIDERPFGKGICRRPVRCRQAGRAKASATIKHSLKEETPTHGMAWLSQRRSDMPRKKGTGTEVTLQGLCIVFGNLKG